MLMNPNICECAQKKILIMKEGLKLIKATN